RTRRRTSWHYCGYSASQQPCVTCFADSQRPLTPHGAQSLEFHGFSRGRYPQSMHKGSRLGLGGIVGGRVAPNLLDVIFMGNGSFAPRNQNGEARFLGHTSPLKSNREPFSR